MISADIDHRQLALLVKELGDTAPKKLRREIRIAVNATAKKTQLTISRLIRQELAVKAKDVKKAIKITRKATVGQPSATVTLKKEDRLPLRDFTPRQTARGTSYRISKRGGRKTIRRAFMGPSPGRVSTKLRGHVYARSGEARKPIHKLHGASAWGAYQKQRMRGPTNREARRELRKQISRRIRFLRFKRTGSRVIL